MKLFKLNRKGDNMVSNVTLKGLRANVNLTQEEVADYLGKSRDSYRRNEKGDVGLTLDEGFMLSDLFDVPIDVIYRATRF